MKLQRLAGHAPLAFAMLVAAVLQATLIARLPTVSADGITFIAIACASCPTERPRHFATTTSTPVIPL